MELPSGMSGFITGNNRKSSRWVISILRSVLSRCQQEFALDFLLMSVRIPIISGLVFAYVRQMERRIGKAFIRRWDSGVDEVLAVWQWDAGKGIRPTAIIAMSCSGARADVKGQYAGWSGRVVLAVVWAWQADMMVSRAALDRGDTDYPCFCERLFSAAPCLPARDFFLSYRYRFLNCLS